MILQTLAQYYDRLLNDPSVDIAPRGWFHGRLDYVVKLSSKGEFVSLKILKQADGKKMVGRKTLMPCIGKQAVKHANSGKDANLLWDNSSFVFGLGNKGDLKLSSFITVIRGCLPDLEDEALGAVLSFLDRGRNDRSVFSPVLEHPEYGKEISEGRENITFTLENDTSPFVFARPAVSEKISTLEVKDKSPVGLCLISGEKNQPIELCHPVIKGIRKAKPTDPDPNYISFNEQAFLSFRKKQSANAPSSKKAVFAYSTALNYLLTSKRQRMQVGDASTVFWARDPTDFEETFVTCFEQPAKGEEAVKYDRIRSLLSSVRSGVPAEDEHRPFYVLGLAPNASRISIRFWYAGNLKEIKERVARFFEEIEMLRSDRDPEFLSLLQLLSSTATEGKIDNLPPNLGGEFARAVMLGGSYPNTLLAGAVRRCKAEQRVTYARVSIIKACLVRNFSQKNQKEVSVALDKNYDNIGYVLGRLFAVLERIQEKAQSGLNKTIRDTYFGSATSSPLVTFKRLDDLSVHHLAKIRNSGQPTVWFEKMKQEIFGLIPPSGIPKVLKMEDQARFAVGYYHQRQDFFAKKNTTEETGE